MAEQPRQTDTEPSEPIEVVVQRGPDRALLAAGAVIVLALLFAIAMFLIAG